MTAEDKWEELALEDEVISSREMEELAGVLARAQAPALEPGQTDRLLARLEAMMPAPGFRTIMDAQRPRARVLDLLAVVRSQSGLLRAGF